MTTAMLITIGQLALSVIYLVGYFTIMILFMLGYSNIPENLKDTFTSLVSILTAFGGAIVFFWFQRSRSKDEQLSMNERIS